MEFGFKPVIIIIHILIAASFVDVVVCYADLLKFQPTLVKSLEGDALAHVNPLESPEAIADATVVKLAPSVVRPRRWIFGDALAHENPIEESPVDEDEVAFIEDFDEKFSKAYIAGLADRSKPAARQERSALKLSRMRRFYFEDDDVIEIPHIDPNICQTGVQHFAHPTRCDMYMQCVHGKPMERPCGPGTYWDVVGSGNCGYWQTSYCAIKMKILYPTQNCACNDFGQSGKIQQLKPHTPPPPLPPSPPVKLPLLPPSATPSPIPAHPNIKFPTVFEPPVKNPVVTSLPAKNQVTPCEKHEFPEYEEEPEKELLDPRN